MGGAILGVVTIKARGCFVAWLNKHGRLQGKKQDFPSSPFSFSSSFRRDQSCSYH